MLISVKRHAVMIAYIFFCSSTWVLGSAPFGSMNIPSSPCLLNALSTDQFMAPWIASFR
jgi:hypothetical protein